MMVEVLKQAGTWHISKEVLKISVNTGDSWSAQCFKVDGETESGPAAFRGFCLLKILFTSLSWIVRDIPLMGLEGEGAVKVWSCEEASAPAVVKLMS